MDSEAISVKWEVVSEDDKTKASGSSGPQVFVQGSSQAARAQKSNKANVLDAGKSNLSVK